MSKRVVLFLTSLVMVVSMLIIGCAPTPTPSPTPSPSPATTPVQPIELKLAFHVPPTHYAALSFQKWIDELEKRTEGKVKVIMYPGQSLGKIPDEWNMLKSGISDIGWILPMYYPGTFPLADVTDLPYIMPSGQRDLSIVNGLTDKFLNKQFEEVKILWPGLMGFPELHTKNPVSKLEDLKGMQIRTPPGPLTNTIEILGATPTQIASPEVYNALERGTVEGCVIPWEGCLSFKFYEVVHNHTVADLGCGMNIAGMNLKTWNSLPPDIQKVFEELSPWAQKMFNDAANASDEKAISVIKAAGNTIITLSTDERARWIAASKPVIDAWAAKMDAQGKPGTAIVAEARSLAAQSK